MHWGQHVSRLVQLLPTGKGHVFSAYNGVAKAVLGRAIATTNFGMKIDCDLNDYIPNRIFHFGHWEPDVGSQIRRISKNGDVFVKMRGERRLRFPVGERHRWTGGIESHVHRGVAAHF